MPKYLLYFNTQIVGFFQLAPHARSTRSVLLVGEIAPILVPGPRAQTVNSRRTFNFRTAQSVVITEVDTGKCGQPFL